MSSIRGRLKLLERRAALHGTQAPEVIVFWQGELTACPEHARCDIETTTGLHRRRVVHLLW